MNASPVHIYARIVGAVLAVIGILGFFVSTSMDTTGSLIGFEVNLTHNFVHLLSGAVLLAVGWAALNVTRATVGVLGVVYLALGLWGLAVGQPFDPFGLFGNIDTADNWLHLVLGVVALAGVAMSMPQSDTTTTRGTYR